jgi:hypothetical protein
MFAYVNAECTGSIPMSAYANAHTARLENTFVFICICRYTEQTVRLLLLTAVCMVTQMETVVINCNKTTSPNVACIPITEPFCQLTNTLDFMPQTQHVQFTWAGGQGQMKVHTAQPRRTDRLQNPRARGIAC